MLSLVNVLPSLLAAMARPAASTRTDIPLASHITSAHWRLLVLGTLLGQRASGQALGGLLYLARLGTARQGRSGLGLVGCVGQRSCRSTGIGCGCWRLLQRSSGQPTGNHEATARGLAVDADVVARYVRARVAIPLASHITSAHWRLLVLGTLLGQRASGQALGGLLYLARLGTARQGRSGLGLVGCVGQRSCRSTGIGCGCWRLLQRSSGQPTGNHEATARGLAVDADVVARYVHSRVAVALALHIGWLVRVTPFKVFGKKPS